MAYRGKRVNRFQCANPVVGEVPAHSLGRPEIVFDLEPLAAFYASKGVLITGAAGSIGSVLSLAIGRLGCTHLATPDQFDS